MNNPTYELTDLVIREASLVDKGDNPEAQIVFFKRKGASMNQELKMDYYEEDEQKSEHEDEEEENGMPMASKKNLVERIKDWASGNSSEYNVEFVASSASDFDGLRSEYLSSIESISNFASESDAESLIEKASRYFLKKSAEMSDSVQDIPHESDMLLSELLNRYSAVDTESSSTGGTAKTEKSRQISGQISDRESNRKINQEDTMSNVSAEKSLSVDEVLKSLPEEQRKLIEDNIANKAKAEQTEKRLADAESKLAKMLEEKRDAEFLEKAKSMRLAGVEAAVVGSILKRSHEHSEELAADIEKCLSALGSQVRKSNVIFESIGSAMANGASDMDSDSVIEKRAREIAKSDGTTFEQAYVRALQENPEAYLASLASSDVE